MRKIDAAAAQPSEFDGALCTEPTICRQSYFRKEINSVRGHTNEEGSARFNQAINEASATRHVMDDELPTDS